MTKAWPRNSVRGGESAPRQTDPRGWLCSFPPFSKMVLTHYCENGFTRRIVRRIVRVPLRIVLPARLVTGRTMMSARRRRRTGSRTRRRPTKGKARPTETPGIREAVNFSGAVITPATVAWMIRPTVSWRLQVRSFEQISTAPSCSNTRVSPLPST